MEFWILVDESLTRYKSCACFSRHVLSGPHGVRGLDAIKLVTQAFVFVDVAVLMVLSATKDV